MTTNDNEKLAKISNIYECKLCDYVTSRKHNLKIHFDSNKHKNMQTTTVDNVFLVKTSKKYLCSYCDKSFNDRSGLWRHKRNFCEKIQNSKETINTDKDNLINMLVTQNKELMELIKNGINNNSHNITNNNNTHNTNIDKCFNLNFFLNETCKNAMNITDFVSSIKMNLEDLENTGKSGYIEGISNIIVNNLNKLEQHLRPLHCSDFKREVLYIKDNNEWLKETENKPILTKAIKTIANENIKQISKWKDNYPDCINSDSKKNDLYLKIVSNSMNGITKEEGEKNINKIITNIAKKVIIEK